MLARSRFAGRVRLVSKAGHRMAGISLQWLHPSGFFAATGLTESDVHSVRERAEKAEVCVRLGVTHFVDDRLFVLVHLIGVEHRYLFTGGVSEVERERQLRDLPPGIVVVQNWPKLHRILTERDT